MNLLVVGATSRTGLHVLDQAAARGHNVTAFCRHPERLPAGALRTFRGDARRVDDLLPALAGQDAVLTILAGPDLGPTTLVSDASLALIQGMRATGVQRIVATSSRSIVATRPGWAVALAWWVFRNPYRDLARAEGMLQASGLDWRIVRAVRLVDGPATGRVHRDGEADATGGSWKLTRGDYASALLDAVEDPEPTQRAWGVGGAA